MRNFIRSTLRLIAQWWEMILERDERIGHERFVEDVTRERSILDRRRALLMEERYAIAYRYRNAMDPAVCRNQLAWSLGPTQRKLQRIGERLERLERLIGVHDMLCERNRCWQTQHATALH